MFDHYNYIYFSPHLDDVALSCGGQVSRQTETTESVLIVTVTAGDPPSDNLPPFAQAHHASWQLDSNAVAARRAEDVAACQALGADWLHWTVRDAIYRRDPATGEALYNNDVELFGAVNSAETELINQLTDQMQQLPTADQIICPLTVGNHVDHQLTRLAAEKAFGKRLAYYEDYPYAQWHGLGDKAGNGWESSIISFSAANLAQKLRAIAAYHSQIDHLFESFDDMQAHVAAYAEQIGGERIWRFSH